jgi:hypothetical protein
MSAYHIAGKTRDKHEEDAGGRFGAFAGGGKEQPGAIKAGGKSCRKRKKGGKALSE